MTRHMGEIMLTATKGKNGRPGVRYVKLDGEFTSASYAAECARQISQTEADVINGETEGTLYVGSRQDRRMGMLRQPASSLGSSRLYRSAWHIFRRRNSWQAGISSAADSDVRFSITLLFRFSR